MTAATIGIIGISLFVIMDFDNTSQTYRNESMNPEISSFGENTYVVWSESINSEFFDVYFAKITNNTVTKEPLNLTRGESFYPTPEILASGNNDVYVLWSDRTSPHGDETAFFKKSNDGGNTFGDTRILGQLNDSEDFRYTPITMAYSNDVLYVFVFELNLQTRENRIVFISSADGGNTFSGPKPFFQFENDAEFFRVASAYGTIYAVSNEIHRYFNESADIGFRKISPDGKTSNVINLNKTGYFVTSLELAASDENVYLVSVELADEWQRDGRIKEKHGLFFTRSNDGGNTFGEPKKINTDLESNGVESQGIQIISYDDSVYIMSEEDYTDGYGNIHRKTWFAKSNDYGDTFDVVSVHPLDDLRSKYGHVYAYEEDNILYFVVTSETTHFNEDVTIFFVNSHNTNNNNLETFDIVDVIGKSLPTFDVPKIGINDNNVQIIGDVLRGENCILYVSSSDGGEIFSEPVNLSPHGSLEDCFAK